jgi:hypothetical protein
MSFIVPQSLPLTDNCFGFTELIKRCNDEILYSLLEYNFFNPMAITIQNYLTKKQLDFLMSNTLSIFDRESVTYTFIREIFKTEEQNIPIDDSIFLCSIFEFVNLYLYLGEPHKIIPTLNKKNNLKAISKIIKSCSKASPYNFNEIYQNAETLGVGFIYRINPNKQTVKIEIGIWDLLFTYTRSYDKEATSLFNKIQYKVDNLNEFLFKVCTIYDEFIELMPQEELDLEGAFL